MRVGAWLVFSFGLFCLLGGCSSYPLPATPCDELCHASGGLDCNDYDPASCVLECENTHLSDESCRPYFDAQLECVRQNPGAAKDPCDYYLPDGPPGRCVAQRDALAICVVALNLGYEFQQ
jgi:hypothetical protein